MFWPNGPIDTAFEGNSKRTLETAKNECSTACSANANCNFASLYWVEWDELQACYLFDTYKKPQENWAYRLYANQ